MYLKRSKINVVRVYFTNGENTSECINLDEFSYDKECEFNRKESKLKLQEITEDILAQYAGEYVYNYPVVNHYVINYSSTDNDTTNKYHIIIYKLEKCIPDEFKDFIPKGLIILLYKML